MNDGTSARSQRPLRIIFFGDPRGPASTLVLQSLLRAVRRFDDVRVVAVCDAARDQPPPRWQTSAYAVAATLGKRLFDPARRPVLHQGLLTGLAAIARQHQIPVLVPPNRDVNHPDFIATVRDDLGANTAILAGCVQVFRPPLIAAFDDAVNLHGATLSRYRGLATTGWSIYRGERRTGFTYHRVVPGIDEGPILRRGEISVPDEPDVAQIEFEKFIAAAAQIRGVLDDLVAGAPGFPQEGEAGYFGLKDVKEIRTVEKPERLSYAEIERRIRAFQSVWLQISGSLREATKIERAEGRRHADFTTSDGVPVVVTRIGFLPPALHRIFGGSSLIRTESYGPASAKRGSGPQR